MQYKAINIESPVTGRAGLQMLLVTTQQAVKNTNLTRFKDTISTNGHSWRQLTVQVNFDHATLHGIKCIRGRNTASRSPGQPVHKSKWLTGQQNFTS